MIIRVGALPILLVVAAPVVLLACSDSGSGSESTGGTTSVSAPATGGTHGEGGNGGQSTQPGTDAGVTVGCPVWPKQRLFPYVGPHFYGPDPGPCTIQLSGGAISRYTYDSQKRPISVSADDGSLDVVFKYEGDFIIQEVDSRSTGETVCDYQYGTETAGYTVSGTVGYTATYTLDPQGYPRELLITNVATASAEWPVRYTYRYEGCVMMDRIAYKADGSESGSTLHYTYDGVGHMVRQVSTDGRTDTTFEYSCWAH